LNLARATGLSLLLGLAQPAVAGVTPGEAGDGTLGSSGEQIADATIERVELHDEFERYHLRWADGRTLPVEVVPESSGTGVCTHGGATLFPRWELVGGTGEEAAPAAVLSLCERLAVRAPDFRPVLRDHVYVPPTEGVAGGVDHAIGHRSAPRLHPTRLHGVVGLVLVLGLVVGAVGWRAADRADRRALAVVTALAALLRLGLSPRQVYLASGAGYEALALAWGVAPPHALYGGGMAALFGPGLAWLGRGPAQLSLLTLGLSLLVAPLAWTFGRLMLGREAALVLALLVGVLPAHLVLSATEVAQGPVFVFIWLALAATAGMLAAPTAAVQIAAGGLAGLTAGFCGHLRPEALPVALLPPLLVLCLGYRKARRMPGFAALLAGSALLFLGRLAELEARGASQTGALHPGELLDVGVWFGALLPSLGLGEPPRGFQVYLHTWWTPVAWMALAVVGFIRGPRRLVAFAGLAWLIVGVPLLPKTWPLADAVRLQLQAMPAWLLLTAIGAGVAIERAPARLRPWLPWLLAALALPRLPWALRPWANQEEQAIVARAVAAAPAGTVLLYNPDRPHSERYAEVWDEVGGGRLLLLPMGSRTPAAGEWLLVDTLCHAGPDEGVAPDPQRICNQLRARCDLQPVDVQVLAGRSDLDLFLPPQIEVGVYRVLSCPQ
jgi:hypothetical protein